MPVYQATVSVIIIESQRQI